MKKSVLLGVTSFLGIFAAQAAPPVIKPVVSPRVISVVTTNQDGRGNQFRATLVRRGGEDNANLAFVFEQINYGDGGAGKILSQLVVEPSQMHYGKDSAIADLAWSTDGSAFTFTLEPRGYAGKLYHCRFALPDEPVYGAQPLTTANWSCQ